MACAAQPSPLPVATLAARRRGSTSAVPAYHPQSSRLSWRQWLPSENAPRARLRAEASKADPVEESLPAVPAPTAPSETLPRSHTSTWSWKGYNIRYQYAGTSGPALVLIHGFGANSDHWRKNIPVLAMANRVYAIDLIGYGYSDKPNPRQFEESFYTFETWGEQLNTFCAEVVKSDAFFICNSIGGLVGLQAAVMEPQTCKGIVLLDISLRMLHISKQPWYGKPFIRSFQNLLRNTVIGKLFFSAVATPESVKNILSQMMVADRRIKQLPKLLQLLQRIVHHFHIRFSDPQSFQQHCLRCCSALVPPGTYRYWRRSSRSSGDSPWCGWLYQKTARTGRFNLTQQGRSQLLQNARAETPHFAECSIFLKRQITLNELLLSHSMDKCSFY